MKPGPRPALALLALLIPLGAAHADPKAAALLARARKVAESTRTLQAEATAFRLHGQEKESELFLIRLMKPNKGHVTVKLPDGKIAAQFLCDGTSLYFVNPAAKEYQRMPAGRGGLGTVLNFYAPIVAFYQPGSLIAGPEHRYAGTRKVKGTSYQVVTLVSKTPPGGTRRYFFRPDGLLEGMEAEISQAEPGGGTHQFWLRNVKLNAPMPAGQLAFKPPTGFNLSQPGGDVNASLLKEGADAPDFRLPTPDGSELSLTAAREGKKVVLLNFWFHG